MVAKLEPSWVRKLIKVLTINSNESECFNYLVFKNPAPAGHVP